MGLPSKRRTKTSKRDRASHFALKAKSLIKCSNCGQPVRPHRACAVCGFYKGKAAVKIKVKTKSLKKKAQERREKAREKENKE